MYHTITSISEGEVCQNCGKNINLAGFFKSDILGGVDNVKYMNAFLSGNVERMGGTGGVENVGSYRLSYSSQQTYCEECYEFIDEQVLLEAIKSEKPVKCTKCGHSMPLKLADYSVSDFHPEAIAIINDSTGIDQAEKNIDKSSMIVFSCMSCGAGLELTKDTKRTMKCSYCGNENYLPDIIWTKLHTHKEVSPLFVILDIDGNDMKEAVNYFLNVTMAKIYDRHFENFIREYFEKPFTSDAVNSWFRYFLSAKNNPQASFNTDIERLQRSFYQQLTFGYENHRNSLREIAAEYGNNIPVELQNKLAIDSDEAVRLALTKNNSLEKSVIKKLQNDSSPVVAAEAKKKKTGLFKSLFG
jgi:DNA-directed RNA polymerase subunit RPC12/RpoP